MKKFLSVLAVALGTLFVTGQTVSATAPPPVTVDADSVSTIVIAAPWVTIIVSLLIPVLNGLLTTVTTSSGVKAILTIVLNAAWSLIASGLLADGTAVFSSTTLYTAIVGCVISIASYVGLYRPMNVTSTGQNGKLAHVGIT